MTNPTNPAPPPLGRSFLLLVISAVFAGASAFAAAPARVRFDIPAGDARPMLRQFATQAGTEIVFVVESVDGIRTNAVRGEFTPDDAAARLLVGTNLQLVKDAKTGAFAVVRDQSAGRNAAPSLPPPSPGPVTRGSTEPAATPPVVLSPFTVETSQDRGYQAQTTLAGSRLKTNLKDVASPTSAFTETFLRDLGLTNLEELAPYMLSTELAYNEDIGTTRLAGNTPSTESSRSTRVRGLSGGTVSVNYFKSPSVRFDTFNTDRIDQSRGPNSVLFGVGNPGGIVNVSTKRAVLNEPRGSLAFIGRSYDGWRYELDVNQPVVRDRLAVRIATAKEESHTWRDFEFDKSERYYATLKWRPTTRTELNLDAEKSDMDRKLDAPYVAGDQYTIWASRGRAISATPDANLGIARLAATSTLVFDTATGTLADWRNQTVSVLKTSVDGQGVALRDFSILPRTTTLRGPGQFVRQNYHRLSGFLTHSFTPQLNLEVAAMRTDEHYNNSLEQEEALRVDTSPRLPTGEPNPNAGRPYIETTVSRRFRDSRTDAARGMLAYRHDAGRWGRHTLAGAFETNFYKESFIVVSEYITSPNAPDPSLPESGQNAVNRRTYVDLNGPVSRIRYAELARQPIRGLREQVTGRVYESGWVPLNANTRLNSNEGTTATWMLQSSFWRERLHTIVGGSRDRRDDYFSTQGRRPVPGFTQGVRYAIRSHTPDFTSANGLSFSGVFHATPWLSLTYSKAQNSALPPVALVDAPKGGGLRTPTPKGRSQDIGFKLDLFQQRLFLTATYFETRSQKEYAATSATTSAINVIWDGLEAAGVLRASAIALGDVRGLAVGETSDGRTSGYELELTANLTPTWRTYANFSDETTERTNIGQEVQAYFANFRPFFERFPTVPVAGGAGTVANQLARADAAAYTSFVVADGRRPAGQIKRKANLRTNYEFASEKLKGFSVGGGVRYFGRPVVGYFASGTAATGVQRRIFEGPEQVFVDASAGYRRRLGTVLGRRVQWTLQLNVNNVLDNDDVVPIRKASDGELVFYRFNAPRSWMLTSRFMF
jgi:iron complex outermembrane receptor protein